MTHQKTSLRFVVGCALTVATLLVQPATGQNTSPPRFPAPPLIDPQACSGQERLPADKDIAPKPDASSNLSEKLERSEGVICPPLDVDPDIAVVPHGGGRTPVIPPPGSPGGDPTVRPK